jgi:hypothetical protein
VQQADLLAIGDLERVEVAADAGHLVATSCQELFELLRLPLKVVEPTPFRRARSDETAHLPMISSDAMPRVASVPGNVVARGTGIDR